MTDTGQVPGEGLPESAGMVEQPGVPAAPGAYTYLSETTAEDEDLLMPGSQGAWGNEVAPPAPEPVVETLHEPDAHEISGRDSGSVDLSAVRVPGPTAPTTPIPPITPRRPLHLGPPIPDASASPVRSLADRGAVGVPARHPGATGPEYLDVPQHREAAAPQAASPWGAPAQAAQVQAPAPVGAGVQTAETVVPAGQSAGVAQAAPAVVADAPAVDADAQAADSDVPQAAVAEVPVPHEGVPGGQVPQAAHAAPAVAVDPAVAAGHAPGTGHAVSAGEMPDAAQVPAADPPGAEGGEVPVNGADPEAGQGVEPEQAAEDVPVTEGATAAEGTAPEAEQAPEAAPVAGDQAAAVPVAETGEAVPAPEAAQHAELAAAEAAEVAEAPAAEAVEAVAVPVPGGVEAVAVPAAEAVEVAAVPVAEAVEAVAVPAAEAVEVAAVPVPGGVEAVAVPAAEAVEVAAVPVPEAVEAVAAPAPEPAQLPEAPAADAEQTPEAAPVVDAAAPGAPAQVADAPAPEVAQAPEALPVGEVPQAPEALPVAEVPQAAAQDVVAAPAQVQPTPEAVPDPTAPEAAQAPRPADAEPVGQAPQPTQDASVAVAPEPAPQAGDVEQAEAAQQQPEPSVPVEAAAQDPQPVPDAVAAPELAQSQQPAQDDAPAVVPADAAVAAQAVAASATAPEAEAHMAEPAAQMPDAEQPQEVTAESAEAPQPLAVAAVPDPSGPDASSPAPQPVPADAVPAEAPEPFVAEPAGPQLQPAAQSAPAPEDQAAPAQPDALPSGAPLEPTPVGQFVPVEGSVPTTPHLAPTPPQPIVLPVEEAPAAVATVPAPREGDPDVVQHAEDLDTRAADQEDPQEESTAAVEEARQSTGPAAPAYDDAEREAVLKVMRERRDIRNGFRSDPIPHEVLLRVLEAAHTAPSVGHSQPWDFVVIRSGETRRTMHELAQRQREAYAKSLPKGRAKQFKELKIEAILDTPVNIVVTADPTRGGRHTLGRHTQPQMAPYSAALAVENLWLAARAEGLGVGWVSFFDEREMVRALGLPEHLEVIAYLCVGYVDEFPDEPELMQAGWSKRRPLSWVVHEETYGRRALPGEEPHDLLAETVAQIRPLDAKALGEAWERQKRMTKPAGALGMLEIISAQLSGLSRQCPPPIPEPAAVAIFAGDHGVHAQGVTPWPQEVTAQMVANFLGGGAVCNAFAGQVGAEVCVVDVGVAADLPATPGLLPRKVRGGTSDMTTGPAMTREEAKQAIEVGIETARDLVAAGNKALLTGEMGIANTTASAALISVFTDTDPAEVTGRGTGINDETLARKTEVVRRAIEVHQPDPADPIGVLSAIGGFEHAALVGLLLGGASLRTPVILDGVSAGAAALVARAIAPEVLAACIAGHRSAEPGHVAALNKLGLRPLVDLDLRLGEGTGALLALPLVQSTARAMHEVATFDSAGVTEK
ncbi:nicotinate-nucleotide--dimethylbenzimidazole phosphoribosyltransferase [Streptomyces sp. HD]|uniref:nicotinate-nucleotide--dimethylbenzimidazole phosphoribosyltransferase n=1 Tax=Streptomyces sp. HD TaxID=3020892 RepID=UPI00232CA97B|nr:nicotinate-nucleotide--dimethylbenzimidazole phosphoribosyltransferase [Streptomyces sp. HD]MDC0767697.1 nicotinate-nucleotide--dimethylbenzimidazole phosphoribosyltransferase [Streptomyces sp. HD]